MPAEPSFAGLQCPAHEQLIAFQRGQLSEADMESVSDHLSRCSRCEDLLRQLPETSIAHLLRGSKPDPLLQEPELGRLEEAARLFGRPAPREQPAAASAASQRGHTTVDQHPATPALAEPIPTVVGLYEILEKIGSGGMGVVYRARHQAIKRTVALKMLRDSHIGDSESLTRFCVEGEAVARVRHPNVVQIYQFDQHEGHLYFTMEYLAGGSLSRRLNGKPLPQRLAARLVRDLAHGVHAVHQQRIVHRDLKPANVLLDGPAGAALDEMVPKVADFGLARLMDDVEGANTQTDAVLGTPSYMAPEQAAGRIAQVNERTDVYALGIILYECLTGQPPFKAQSRAETMELVKIADPRPPSQLRPGLDRDLEAIGLKCLERDPARRYSSAEDLAFDLERWLGNRPTQARPLPRLSRAARWVRRHKALTAAALALVLFSGMGLTAAYWFSPKARLHEAERGLQRGEVQVLIGDSGKPAWFEVMTGKQKCQTLLGADGSFTVYTWAHTVVELMQHPRCQRYRFRADLRHNHCDITGTLGIYVGRHEHPSAATVHEFVAATYYDLRDDRADYDIRLLRGDFKRVPQPPPRPLGNRVSLNSRLLAETDPRPYWPGLGGAVSQIFTATMIPTWRTISLEVSPEGVRGYWADDANGPLSPMGQLSAQAITDNARRLLDFARKQPDSNPCVHGWEPIYTPQGGLGLYVDFGSASFRHVVVEPLE